MISNMKSMALVICSLWCLALFAQEPSLYFERLTVRDGLSHNKVNCMLQDRRGFVWIGTNDGLNRFDGRRFVHFRYKPGDTSTVSGNIITDLLEDREGRLWIATADGGISRYDHRLPPRSQFRQYRHIPGNAASIPVNAVNTLLDDEQGHLWIGTSGRFVLRFNKTSGQFHQLSRQGKTVLDLCFDGTGKIWVGGHGGGIIRIDPASLQTIEDERYRNLYARLPHVTVTSFYRDRDNHIWFGSWDKMLYRRDAATGKEEVYRNQGPYSFRNDEIDCFAEDGEGRIWMGGRQKGLHIYDKANSRFYNYQYNPAYEGAIADNRVNCLFRDREGRMWIGTDGGISINSPTRQQFVQQFLSDGKEPVTIHDFYEPVDGSLWIGTSAGLFIRSSEGRLSHHRLSYRNTPLQVSAFYREENGTIYLGTQLSLFRYNPGNGTVSLLPGTERDGVMRKIIESRVVSITGGAVQGRPVLFAVPYGHYLAYYDFTQRRWVSRLDSLQIVQRFNLQDNLIRKLYRSRTNTVWMATAKSGLAKWSSDPFPQARYFRHNPANPYSLQSNHVFDLEEDEKGNLWVSTYGSGLHYFDVRTEKALHISGSNNLTEGIRTDRNQMVWMIANGQVHRYDPLQKVVTSFHLPDREKTGGVKGTIFRDSKGRLYVAGLNYFISFDPDSVSELKAAPRVVLTDFRIFNQSLSHLLNEKEIRLGHGDNFFGIEFAAPYFREGTPVQYAYQLEGVDQDWVEAGERNYVNYSNLEGGRYRFRVKAATQPGSWTEDFASIELVVIPPFWKQWWFLACGLLLLAAAAYLVYRYRINELLKRQAIRNRIAQDLHDNVGSTLSSISVYSQVARIYHQQDKDAELFDTLGKISATSSDMISELNDTVWAINPRNDSMDVMLQRMESFAKPLLASQDVRFHLSCEPGLAGIGLQMEKRKNFYLIFKEAVNNVLKYAHCRNLWVTVQQKGRHLHLRMADDGKGFKVIGSEGGYRAPAAEGGGNGLRNMQQRAAELGGTLTISSKPGQGTEIELKFPIT